MKNDSFASLLREWRDLRGFSQREAAGILKICEGTLQNWELHHVLPEVNERLAVIRLIKGDFAEIPCAIAPPEGWVLPTPDFEIVL